MGTPAHNRQRGGRLRYNERMKPNDPHHWRIELCPATTPSGPMRSTKIFGFVGTVDEVLAEADELESEVGWEVQQFIITRGLKA